MWWNSIPLNIQLPSIIQPWLYLRLPILASSVSTVFSTPKILSVVSVKMPHKRPLGKCSNQLRQHGTSLVLSVTDHVSVVLIRPSKLRKDRSFGENSWFPNKVTIWQNKFIWADYVCYILIRWVYYTKIRVLIKGNWLKKKNICG